MREKPQFYTEHENQEWRPQRVFCMGARLRGSSEIRERKSFFTENKGRKVYIRREQEEERLYFMEKGKGKASCCRNTDRMEFSSRNLGKTGLILLKQGKCELYFIEQEKHKSWA